MDQITEITTIEEFDYSNLSEVNQAVVRQKVGEIKDRQRQASQCIVEIGERLLEVKEILPYGQFLPWISAEFGWSQRMAYNMMNAAKMCSVANFASLGSSEMPPSALYLLAEPSTPDSARLEVVEELNQGKVPTYGEVAEKTANHKGYERDRTSTPPTKTQPEPQYEVGEILWKMDSPWKEVRVVAVIEFHKGARQYRYEVEEIYSKKHWHTFEASLTTDAPDEAPTLIFDAPVSDSGGDRLREESITMQERVQALLEDKYELEEANEILFETLVTLEERIRELHLDYQRQIFRNGLGEMLEQMLHEDDEE